MYYIGPFLLTSLLIDSLKPNSRKYAPEKPEVIEEPQNESKEVESETKEGIILRIIVDY